MEAEQQEQQFDLQRRSPLGIKLPLAPSMHATPPMDLNQGSIFGANQSRGTANHYNALNTGNASPQLGQSLRDTHMAFHPQFNGSSGPYSPNSSIHPSESASNVGNRQYSGSNAGGSDAKAAIQQAQAVALARAQANIRSKQMQMTQPSFPMPMQTTFKPPFDHQPHLGQQQTQPIQFHHPQSHQNVMMQRPQQVASHGSNQLEMLSMMMNNGTDNMTSPVDSHFPNSSGYHRVSSGAGNISGLSFQPPAFASPIPQQQQRLPIQQTQSSSFQSHHQRTQASPFQQSQFYPMDNTLTQQLPLPMPDFSQQQSQFKPSPLPSGVLPLSTAPPTGIILTNPVPPSSSGKDSNSKNSSQIGIGNSNLLSYTAAPADVNVHEKWGQFLGDEEDEDDDQVMSHDGQPAVQANYQSQMVTGNSNSFGQAPGSSSSDMGYSTYFMQGVADQNNFQNPAAEQNGSSYGGSGSLYPRGQPLSSQSRAPTRLKCPILMMRITRLE
ncbi:hypothetical protein BC830DRAFT_46666 [Chytriomyces sp. MP71]|nr:hypothetical protein BC830DRAFT_46666 [Chytriomyces sp. MP71]